MTRLATTSLSGLAHFRIQQRPIFCTVRGGGQRIIARAHPELAAAAIVLVAVAAETRPRGWCDTKIVEARQSSIHNLGVFAKIDILKGTVMGAYPGFKRSRSEMDEKVRQWPEAKGYVFASDHGWYLDPTDATGKASPRKLWWTADTTLAFVNEPMQGQDTNISISDGVDELDILFVASRNINNSEELLVDYGKFYDRSNYQK